MPLKLAKAQFLAHGLDDRRVIGFAKNSAARHKSVGAGIGHAANVVNLDAAIDLQANVFARRFNPFARLLYFAQRAVNEALTAKARVDRHDEDQVDVFDDPLKDIE